MVFSAKILGMTVKFTKMHGIGNDYVYINGFETTIEDPAGLARKVSDRNFGIGSDGLILIQPPGENTSHCRMEMYNADGSRAQMCGNGIRCVAKYVHDHGIVESPEVLVETDAGVKKLLLETGPDGKVSEVAVDMGAPGLKRNEVPLDDGGDGEEAAIGVPLEVEGCVFRLTGVSMGNPHAVIRLDETQAPGGAQLGELGQFALEEWGPRFENHPWFPQGVNTEFVVPRSRTELDFRVWERGSGETLACGTGACAAVVAGVLNDWCEREALVHLRGGDLKIRWDGNSREGTVWMTGPATEVYSGEFTP